MKIFFTDTECTYLLINGLAISVHKIKEKKWLLEFYLNDPVSI